MSLILPQNYPEDIIFHTTDFAQSKPKGKIIKLALLNTMANTLETEAQLLNPLSDIEGYDVEITFFTPSAILNSSAIKIKEAEPNADISKYEHRIKFHRSLEDFNPEEYDGAILTGAPVASEPLQQREEGKGVTYFEEYIATLDKIKQSNTPTLAICWASHVALNHFYEVPRHKREQGKLTGVFNVLNQKPEHKLMNNVGDGFDLPVSRNYLSDEALLQANVIPLASSEETGTALAADKDGPFIYMTGHLEYDPQTLREEAIRDIHCKGLMTTNENRGAPIPRNYDIHAPAFSWKEARKTIFGNLMSYFADARDNKQSTQPHSANENNTPQQQPSQLQHLAAG
ncbi:MAG: hypothetical protein CMH26_06245 [Micavibrio sp.]|nr:hypothetical protein [Micavibrio sp.]|tara:strand:+ start:1006 stop:2034 length:1029 start_codon:yes stop_codon:yes gene_type:complete